jgi:cytochrome P450
LIAFLVILEVNGERLYHSTIQRMLVLQLVAGIYLTRGVLGQSLWHLAGNPADRKRLITEPELLPTAVKEFLRAFASVSLWRTVTQTVSVRNVEMSAGDTVMMALPAACRDPQAFENADQIIINRAKKRHVAFGADIDRCLGST